MLDCETSEVVRDWTKKVLLFVPSSSRCARLPEPREKELEVLLVMEEAGVEGVGILLMLLRKWVLSRSSLIGLPANDCFTGVGGVVFNFFPPLRISLSGSLPLRRRSLDRELLDSFESGS